MTKKQKFNVQIVAVVSIAVIALLALNFWAIPMIQHKGSASSLTAQIILANGQVINLDSQTPPKGLTIVSETGSGNGISSTVGAAISQINTNFNFIPTFTGTVASYTVSGTFGIEINNAQGGTVWAVNKPLESLNPTLVSGKSVILSSSTASTYQAPFSGVGLTKGQIYTLVDFTLGVSISGTFTDGSAFGPINAQNAQINWVFKYQ